MKVVTNAQARAADLAMFERGTPVETLMERAGNCLFEFLQDQFRPLAEQRVVIFCGTGNNGGDGQVLAQLLERRVGELQVVHATDAAIDYDRDATIVVDALLGTGYREPVQGRYAELIRAINEDFPKAKIVAVDLPSAMQVRADYTVTFAAPKAEMLLSTRAHNIGKLIVADIGIAPELLESGLWLSEAKDFRPLFAPRPVDAHKGAFGHVLVVGGARGKTGAAAMAGLAALKAGAGLVTVACSSASRLAPELMTEDLDEIGLEKKTVLAIGPGLGMRRKLMSRVLFQSSVPNVALRTPPALGAAAPSWTLPSGTPSLVTSPKVIIPAVIDADALNCLAREDGTETDFQGLGVQTILTPHPGEMARLLGTPSGTSSRAAVADRDRISTARTFAKAHNLCLVLKGYRSLIAFPDGNVWINPTGSPAMAKGGAGDILTGLIAGLIAQWPNDIALAVRAAVWLHGRAGELAAEALTEQCVLATELLMFLPRAIRECR
jgi:ADP-dependent NAD(P)H-hydrate dehydratase / NAD(P)H-hydrate epimerase